MILYGMLEPQWDFTAEAPNDVPRDMPNTREQELLVHQTFQTFPNYYWPHADAIYEAPRGPFMGTIGHGFWVTPSQGYFYIPANTVYFEGSPAPVKSGPSDQYAQGASYPNNAYFFGQAPTTGIYTGSSQDEY